MRSSVRRSGSTVEVPSGGTGLEDDTFPDPPEDVLQPLYGSRRWSTADGGFSFAQSTPRERIGASEQERWSRGIDVSAVMRSPTRLDAAVRSRSPSTRGRGVQSPPERRRSPSSVRRLATIKLDSLDGNSVPLSTHLAKLDNCSHYYG
jgi:hypothetical protein